MITDEDVGCWMLDVECWMYCTKPLLLLRYNLKYNIVQNGFSTHQRLQEDYCMHYTVRKVAVVSSS